MPIRLVLTIHQSARRIVRFGKERFPIHFIHRYSAAWQLVASRCRSPNCVYNPQKPGKFGELVRWSADAEYRYVYKGNPYTKPPNDPAEAARQKEANKATNLVLDLVALSSGSGCNITGDRYFSSLEIASKLLSNHHLTYLGTMITNHREIPAVLHRDRAIHTSEFAFGGDDAKSFTQCCYQAKETKKVFMISSQHHDRSICNDNPYKPHMILEYNRTKAGVDVIDQMCRKYTVRS